VFAFFADPHNLPRLMPPELKTRIDKASFKPAPAPPGSSSQFDFPCDRAAGLGSEMLISFCPVPFLPLRVRWLARITGFEWNGHFKDEQVRGPFAVFRHRHGTRAESRNGCAGTLVTDEIEFALPFGPLGRLVAPLVRLQLQSSFAKRQRRLPQMLAAEEQTKSSSA
ncbi:MAG: SRPBCC family protein, partial [Terriglobia bacterium]|nr:SRPBCC family protein [Terriglobia bacterium]